MSVFVRQVRAHEGEIVEIRWTCADGTMFYQRLTIPPKATRDAGRDREGATVDGVHGPFQKGATDG